MRTTAIKYQDRNQNEVLLATSDTHFPILFLQKKCLTESSEFRSNHDVSPYYYSFTFTGKERDAETGFSYFGARYYDSDLSGLFLSVDPMADKYPNISPYAYCHWNPIKLVDLDVQEDWEVDKLGHITKCQEQPQSPTEDRIRIKGSNGWSEENSISGISRGTISEQGKVPLKNADTEYGSLMIMGGTKEDRLKVFKFCADNSNVEFTLMEFYDGDNHISLLTTSHDERAVGKDKIGDGLGSAIAKKYFSTLQLHIHNHFGSGQYGWGASRADIDFRDHILGLRNDLIKKHPTIQLPTVDFMIYKCRGNDRQLKSYL